MVARGKHGHYGLSVRKGEDGDLVSRHAFFYDEGVSPARVCRETRTLTAAGKTVMAQQRQPDRGVFGEVRRLTEKEDRDA